MITATHAIIYANDPEAARAFFRDVLRLPNVDVHGGWLIFKLPPAELGIHPAGEVEGGLGGGGHQLWIMCDDLEGTVAELRGRGAVISDEVTEAGFGRFSEISVPGAGEIGLYEPRHATAYDLPG